MFIALITRSLLVRHSISHSALLVSVVIL